MTISMSNGQANGNASTPPLSGSRVQPIAKDLWELRHELALPGGVRMPLRMTIVRHPGAQLSLISPVPIDDAVAAELRELGEVRQLISPSAFHYFFLAQARQRYPEARLCVPPGISAKNLRSAPDLVFAPDHPTELGADLCAQVLAGAPRAGEVCLLHSPTRTLIVGDLVFNIQHYRGFATGLVLRLGGTRHRLAASRVWHLLRDDSKRLRSSIERVLAWDFDRLVVSHGEVVAQRARAALEQGLGFLLAAR
jgi:hypothetical protein